MVSLKMVLAVAVALLGSAATLTTAQAPSASPRPPAASASPSASPPAPRSACVRAPADMSATHCSEFAGTWIAANYTRVAPLLAKPAFREAFRSAAAAGYDPVDQNECYRQFMFNYCSGLLRPCSTAASEPTIRSSRPAKISSQSCMDLFKACSPRSAAASIRSTCAKMNERFGGDEIYNLPSDASSVDVSADKAGFSIAAFIKEYGVINPGSITGDDSGSGSEDTGAAKSDATSALVSSAVIPAAVTVMAGAMSMLFV